MAAGVTSARSDTAPDDAFTTKNGELQADASLAPSEQCTTLSPITASTTASEAAASRHATCACRSVKSSTAELPTRHPLPSRNEDDSHGSGSNGVIPSGGVLH
jgi:hypothetical protein